MHWKIHKEGRVFVENCLRERGNTEDTDFRTATREECIITRGGGVREREKTCELANQNRGSSAHEKDPEGSNSRDSRNVISKEVQGRRGGEDLNGKEKDEVVRGRLNDHRWIPPFHFSFYLSFSIFPFFPILFLFIAFNIMHFLQISLHILGHYYSPREFPKHCSFLSNPCSFW